MINYCECSICKKEKWCRLYDYVVGNKTFWYYVCDDCVQVTYENGGKI